MDVVIVESAAKIKTIAKCLGPDYTIFASYGHVRDLPSKNGSVRPDEDFAMDYEVSERARKTVKTIADATKKAKTLYLATDPDREGEAIAWHLVEVLKSYKAASPSLVIKRVAFNEITEKAIREAFKHPRTIDMDLVFSQQSRRALDYLVGFTLSPLLWRNSLGRSAGRVQSVALRLICEREEEIEKFVTQEYWDITATFLTPRNEEFTARLTHAYNDEGILKKLEKFSLINKTQAESLAESLKDKSYFIEDIEHKTTKRHPYPPFTTSTLQQEASHKLGFNAKRTMAVAQQLYEGIDLGKDHVGLITYMRTDGVTVSQEALHATREWIEKKYGKNYLPGAMRHYKTKAKNAQEAHEAVRPTDIHRHPDSMRKHLNDEQLKLYTLIWNRMIASQMESALIDQVAIIIPSTDKQATFRATGSTIRFDGFLLLYKIDEKETEEGSLLPVVNKEEKASLQSTSPNQHFTQPPPRYSEATLIKNLEELGIGRPSTYTSIISVLQDRNYVYLEKKRFIPEERGRLVTAFLISFFKRYVEYDFTAKLEEELDHISSGEMVWKTMLKKFWGEFDQQVSHVKQETVPNVLKAIDVMLSSYFFPSVEGKEADKTCPACGKGELHLKISKYGAFAGCSCYPECNFTKAFAHNKEADAAVLEEVQGKKIENNGVILGKDKESSLDISIRKGPYGFYVQLGEATEENKKPKRMTIPKTMDIEKMDLHLAQKLISLPRNLGKHPETDQPIVAALGPYGPYLTHNKKNYRLSTEDDVLDIDKERAIEIIAKPTKAASSGVIKVIGQHPDGGDISLCEGRYGKYLKYNKINAKIPKGMIPEEVTLEEAIELFPEKSKSQKSVAKKKPVAAKGAKTKKPTVKKKSDL